MNDNLIQEVQSTNGVLSIDLIKRLLDDHSSDAQTFAENYDLYKGGVAIKDRTFADNTKINRTLANDYIGYVVDQFGGYFIGNPIVYDFVGSADETPEVDKLIDVIDSFGIRSNIADGDAQINKYTSICGRGYRLLYVDKTGLIKAVTLKPWEVIYIPKSDGDGAIAAIRYRPAWREGQNVTLVDVYTETKVKYYVKVDEAIIDDIRDMGAEKPHLFDEVPIIEFVANDERQNDFDKVLSLIDSVDRALSDCQNEVEEFRLSYMAFVGTEVDNETVVAARVTGAFSLPEGASASFLTKNIPESFIGAHLKRLNDAILKFAKAVDMSDEKFSGAAQSGESRKWKLISLENKAITRERKFVGALRIQYRCLGSAWGKKGITISYEDMKFQFTRNIPVEIASAADIAAKLQGLISKRTQLSLMPFVDDIDDELQRLEDEGVDLSRMSNENNEDNFNDEEPDA